MREAGGMSTGRGQSQYLYERLSATQFQQLCGALLKLADEGIRCYPLGQADGGVDHQSLGGGPVIIYQSKSTSDPVKNRLSWLKEQIRREEGNIRRLAGLGATTYWFMTNVQASGNPKNDEIAAADRFLATKSEELGLTMRCEWGPDLDARMDSAPDALKWRFADALAGWDLIRFLLAERDVAREEDALRDWLVSFIASQHSDDLKDKFVQIKLNKYNLMDLFVDVEASRVASPRNVSRLVGATNWSDHSGTRQSEILLGGAAKYLATTKSPFTLVRGAPGQGKSTLTQYLCQLHRSFFLNEEPAHRSLLHQDRVRFPIRIDLRDYAKWCAGGDPFVADAEWSSEAEKLTRGRSKKGSAASRSDAALELFIADLVNVHAGGHEVKPADVRMACKRLPLLVVLDGLDEVGNDHIRSQVVREIDRFTHRMRTALVTPQVVVTTRPNASGLAEPDDATFEVVALSDLSESLRLQYLARWADVHELGAREAHDLRRVFVSRAQEVHVAELAANPMQLSILLDIISQRGDAVPTARAPLYESYMERLLDREQAKTPSVRKNRAPLADVTSFLGWRLQARAESAQDGGRMTKRQIKMLMAAYLVASDKNPGIVDDLFRDATDKVWTLTSKVDDTFEFDVQSLREFFAARFLSDLAGGESPSYDRSATLIELLYRAYWLNTARFLAGHLAQNELPSLLEHAEEGLREVGTQVIQLRAGLWTLLADGVFSIRPRSQDRLCALLADWQSVALMPEIESQGGIPVIPDVRAAEALAANFLELVRVSPRSPDAARAVELALRIEGRKDKVRDWWVEALAETSDLAEQRCWLELGAAQKLGRESRPNVVDGLQLGENPLLTAALLVGADMTPTERWRPLVRKAVLAGLCSDLDPTSPTLESAILLALQPSRFLSRAGGEATAFVDLLLKAPSQERMRGAWARLLDDDDRWELVRDAGRIGKGQKGTTSIWANTAVEAARILGPCWLTAEIAVIGAACDAGKFLTGGTRTASGKPLGADPDYTLLIGEVRSNMRKGAWWSEMFHEYPDQLSRATWALALVTTASEEVIIRQWENLRTALSDLHIEGARALQKASERMGATGASRKLPPHALSALLKVEASTHDRAMRASLSLLLPHVDLRSIAAGLPECSSNLLVELARVSPTLWPARVALMARFAERPHAESLSLLEGSKSTTPMAQRVPTGLLEIEVAQKIVGDPGLYPSAWVAFAMKSLGRRLPPLETQAATAGWE
jgi:hypothetical protein